MLAGKLSENKVLAQWRHIEKTWNNHYEVVKEISEEKLESRFEMYKKKITRVHRHVCPMKEIDCSSWRVSDWMKVEVCYDNLKVRKNIYSHLELVWSVKFPSFEGDFYMGCGFSTIVLTSHYATEVNCTDFL